MNAAQALAQWLTGVTKGETAVDAAKRKLEEHVASAPMSAAAAEHRRHIAIKRELEDDVAAEELALQNAREFAEKAKVAADKAEADVEERRIRKLNDELAKLTVEVGADLERVAAKLRRHTDMLAEVERWNANRDGRAYLTDGERRVREVPEKVIPAVYEEMTVWEDGAGNRPYQFRQLPDGQLVPAVNGYMPRKDKVVSRAEQCIAAHMPGGRFRDGIKFIGLKGEALFPPR